jgi:hypothetical protein
MKAIFLFLTFVIAMASMPAFAEIGPINRSTNLDYAGAVQAGTLEQRFINVINGSGGTLAAGKAVVWDLTADNGATVNVSTTATNTPVCIVAIACASLALCKCQTYGYFSAALFDSTSDNATAGKRVYISASTAGYISGRATELATEVPMGIFLDSATASGSVEIFIDK